MEWRTIPGAEDYEVSEFGHVKRVTSGPGTYPGRIIKPSKSTSSGYWLHFIGPKGSKQKTLHVHRAVALAFIGECPADKHQIAHNNGNKEDNHYTNLRWVTYCENAADRKLHGRERCGEDHHSAKLTEDIIRASRHSFANGEKSIRALARDAGVAFATMQAAITGRTWTTIK